MSGWDCLSLVLANVSIIALSIGLYFTGRRIDLMQQQVERLIEHLRRYVNNADVHRRQL